MATLVSDTFTEASDTDLTAHTPDTGTGWTEELNTTSASKAVVIGGGGFAQSLAGGNQSASTLVYSAQPDPATGEYDVEVDVTVEDANSTARIGVIGRWNGLGSIDDTYLAGTRNANPTDTYLWKYVAGTPTELASADVDPTAPYTLKLEILDATKKVYVGGVEKLSSTDNAVTDDGRGGLFWGNLLNALSEGDVDSSIQIDNFVLTGEAAAAGGRVMSSLAGAGGLAGEGGIAGRGGGLAG